MQYPTLDEPAAFAFVNRICSLPIKGRDALLETVQAFLKLREPALRATK